VVLLDDAAAVPGVRQQGLDHRFGGVIISSCAATAPLT
jgi:hypothetical protein